MDYIAYYRVSTAKQGLSGLGLDAQREAVEGYLNGNGSHLVREYTEVESGKRNDRPQLAAALAECKRLKAVLVIAKLDRLARNVHFISGLMESGVDFVAVDMPTANRLTLHILAAVAEHEREMISQRTRAALAQAKLRGVKLGGYRGGDFRNHPRMKACAKFRAKILKTITPMLVAGFTQRRIVEELNGQGIPAYGGGKWSL